MQELKLKILQCGNGISINEIMKDIEKLVDGEQDVIIHKVRKILSSEGVLSMSVEKELFELLITK